jgi:hypothetical protein
LKYCLPKGFLENSVSLAQIIEGHSDMDAKVRTGGNVSQREKLQYQLESVRKENGFFLNDFDPTAHLSIILGLPKFG